MENEEKKRIRLFWHPFLSPAWLVSRAVILIIFFIVLHLLGFREEVSFLSGTPPEGGVHDYAAIIKGVVYALSYFSAWVLVPILLIAAPISIGLKAFLLKKG